MENIKKLLCETLNIDFIQAILSNPRTKEGIIKVKVRPVMMKDRLFLQLESFSKTQAFHENLEPDAALVTDGLRAEYLESMGYDTQVLEFIDMEHTPKNILLRAVKSKEKHIRKEIQCKEQIQACEEFLHASPTLGRLLN